METNPNTGEVFERQPKKLKIRAGTEVAKDDTDKLNCAMWFVRKCGSSKEAERVFRAALAAFAELDKV